MCGIAGYISNDFNENDILNILNSLEHRGPDNQSYYRDTFENKNVCLGHARLSIIDLQEHANQPMHFKNLSLVFNGEIYNYKEIRNKLLNDGASFDTDSDTEVLLKSIYFYGIAKAIELTRGMFAFALYDKEKRTLTLVRDRAGVKPLYYFNDGVDLIFGSESKALVSHSNFKREVDYQSLSYYFKTGTISSDNSIYKKCKQVSPGSYVEIDIKSLKEETTTYWDVNTFYAQEELKYSYEEAKEELEKILLESVKLRMVADVPVGVFLSGGYDSCLTTALLTKVLGYQLNTFTIGFDNKNHNEAHYAKDIANYLGTNHKELYCSSNDVLNIVSRLDTIFDEPFADSSAIPTLLVSEFSSKDVKVILSSDGGDESFWGYTKYQFLEKLWAYKKLFPAQLRQMMMAVTPSSLPINSYNLKTRIQKAKNVFTSKSFEKDLLLAQQLFTDNEISDLFNMFDADSCGNYNDVLEINDRYKKVSAADYRTYLADDILTKVDRTTMSVSIEGREPLLDHKIIEFAARLPQSYKVQGNYTKRILRDITHKYIPRDMIDRPKHGFSAPINEWFQGDLKDQLIDSLYSEDFLKLGIIDKAQLDNELDSFFSAPKMYNSQKLWLLFMLSKWCLRWEPKV